MPCAGRSQFLGDNIMMIEPCKPPVDYYHYSNPESQGALMQQTANWPHAMSMRHTWHQDRTLDGLGCQVDGWFQDDEPVYERVPVPEGLQIESAYTDRMSEWDYDKCGRAFKELAPGGFKNSSDKQLIAFCKVYWPEWDIVAVRVIYYFNVATGFGCPVVQVLYKEKKTAPLSPSR